jgi:hypothetical protein
VKKGYSGIGDPYDWLTGGQVDKRGGDREEVGRTAGQNSDSDGDIYDLFSFTLPRCPPASITLYLDKCTKFVFVF